MDDHDMTPFLYFVLATPNCCGRDNVVSVATRYGLDGSGFEAW